MARNLKNYLTFGSNIADPGDWDENGNVVRPPGLQHSQLLATSLKQAVSDLTEPWNEEDFGWEFLGKVNGISVSVLIQSPDDNTWLVIVIPIVLFPWFRRKKIEAA